MTAMDIVAVVVVGFWLHGGTVESRYSGLARCMVGTPVVGATKMVVVRSAGMIEIGSAPDVCIVASPDVSVGSQAGYTTDILAGVASDRMSDRTPDLSARTLAMEIQADEPMEAVAGTLMGVVVSKAIQGVTAGMGVTGEVGLVMSTASEESTGVVMRPIWLVAIAVVDRTVALALVGSVATALVVSVTTTWIVVSSEWIPVMTVS
jgi:hypothetical protein